MIGESHYLYLGRAARGVYKVGISRKVEARAKELRIAVLRRWHLPFDAGRVETLVKCLMTNAGFLSDTHNSSEHFRCTRDQIEAAIECALSVNRGRSPILVLKAIQRIAAMRYPGPSQRASTSARRPSSTS